MNTHVISEKIFEIRGQKVMLDFDLAALYGVETRVFNQAVKRNAGRFPEDFMFRLTEGEWNSSQHVMSSPGSIQTIESIEDESLENSSPYVKSMRKHRGKTYLPYAFTEYGVTMLASVLKSEQAVKMSIAIVRAFIALKQLAVKQMPLTAQLQEIWQRLGEHDVQLSSIYDAMENLLDEKAAEKKWQDRERIGFKR